MNKSILTIAMAIIMLFAFGCEESAQVTEETPIKVAASPDDTTAVQNILKQWKAAYIAQDVDAIMAVYSDDYSGMRGEGKDGVAQFVQGMKDHGAFDSLDMDISEAQIKFDGDTAIVAPITYSGDWGQIQLENTFKKEANGWKTVSVEEYY